MLLTREFLKPASQIQRGFARFAGSDLPTVEADNGDDFRGTARQEALVGNEDIVPGQRNFTDFVSSFAGQLHHRVSRDTFEDPGFGARRFDDTILNDEDVIARAFGDLALVVEHQGFKRAGVRAFDLGENIVEVVQLLDPRAECTRVISQRARRDQLHAVFVDLFRIERDRVGDDDDLWVAGPANVQPQ